MVPEIWSTMDRIFCHFGLSFAFLTAQTIKILKIWKKMPGDIIILQGCTINDKHKMYDSWDTEHNGQNFLSFWIAFCPFTPQTIQKIKILKNWKKIPGDIIILHMCTISDNHKWQSMMYGSWDMKHDRQNFSSFWTAFCPLPP